MSKIPPALFDNKGTMTKCKKSRLVNILEEKFLSGGGDDDTLDQRVVLGKALVIDAMVVVQSQKGTGTFADYSKNLFGVILSDSQSGHCV